MLKATVGGLFSMVPWKSWPRRACIKMARLTLVYSSGPIAFLKEAGVRHQKNTTTSMVELSNSR